MCVDGRAAFRALRFFLVGALAAIALAATGCGSSGSSSADGTHPADGKQIYTDAGCGGCHTLAAAGSAGSAGPDLDQLKPSAAAVAAQVKHGGGGMPAFGDKLSDKQISALANFVSSSAGR